MGFSRCSHTTRFGSTASPVALALFLQILGPPWNTFLLRHVYLVGLVRMIYPLPLRLFIKPYLPTQGFRMPLGSHNQNPTVFTLRVQCREAINRAPVICDMRWHYFPFQYTSAEQLTYKSNLRLKGTTRLRYAGSFNNYSVFELHFLDAVRMKCSSKPLT